VQFKTENVTDLRPILMQMVQEGKTVEMVDMVLDIIEKLQNETTKLAQMLRWLKQKPYRSSAEIVDYYQSSLFDDDTPADPPQDETPVAPVAKRERAVNGGRKELPDHLPRQEQILEVDTKDAICPECDASKILIGYETSEVLDYVPGHFLVQVYKREKRVCKRCETGLVVAPTANKLIDKGIPGIGLMTEILVSKYRDHLPLYRLEERFSRLGVRIARSSMSSWVQTVTEDLLQPIVDRLLEKMLASFLLQSDDTTLRVLDRNHPKNTLLGYFWFYIGDHRYAYVDFTPNRSREGPIRILKSRKQKYLQTDGYSGYDRLYDGREASLTHVGCWMHARRYFYEAYELKDHRAMPILEYIRDLYTIEANHRDGSDSDRLAARQSQSRPIIDAIQAWLNTHGDAIPPKSRLGKAVIYLRNQWSSLTRFLEDGRLPLDNGEVERAIRPVAIGRKNYLFAGSRRGARNAAGIYSLIASCALNDIPPDLYLRDVLDKIVNHWPASKLDELLPDRWKELHRQNLPPHKNIHSS
jgi:transposase